MDLTKTQTANSRLVARLRECPNLDIPEVVGISRLRDSEEAVRSGRWSWRLATMDGEDLKIRSQYPVWLLLGNDIAVARGDGDTWIIYPLERGTTDMSGAVWREYR